MSARRRGPPRPRRRRSAGSAASRPIRSVSAGRSLGGTGEAVLAVAHDLGHAADLAADDRRAAREALLQHPAEQLRAVAGAAEDVVVDGRQHGHERAAVVLRDHLVGGVVDEADVPALGALAQQRGVVGVVDAPDDVEAHARRQRVDQDVDALVAHDAADVEDAAGGRRLPRRRVPMNRGLTPSRMTCIRSTGGSNDTEKREIGRNSVTQSATGTSGSTWWPQPPRSVT